MNWKACFETVLISFHQTIKWVPPRAKETSLNLLQSFPKGKTFIRNTHLSNIVFSVTQTLSLTCSRVSFLSEWYFLSEGWLEGRCTCAASNNRNHPQTTRNPCVCICCGPHLEYTVPRNQL